jgi:hypothetical protein
MGHEGSGMSGIEKTAKVISPVTLTDAMFVSSTAPEADYAAWSAVTAYVVGNRVIRTSTHRIYERLVSGTTAAAPESDTTNWLDIGPTNRWAMFDNVIGTQTSIASPLTIVINPGSISGISLMELVGRTATITLKTATGGATAYSKTISLDGTILDSIYDWFYQPYVQQSAVTLTDLPFHYPAGELTVTITASSGNVSCGVCKFGEVIELGAAEYGATSGIIDYSKKEKDTFGRYSVVQRSYSKRMTMKLITEKSDYERISRALANLRALPAVWVATEASGYDPLTVYGFFRDFSIDVAYPAMHYCSLEIEGLI